mmetsp:Transcript_149475/g.258877  ORF Transcript_149475/g.258877 Transcript_149475/m.258877 type:complete len:82 (+) Transcript_149475:3-248(+)
MASSSSFLGPFLAKISDTLIWHVAMLVDKQLIVLLERIHHPDIDLLFLRAVSIGKSELSLARQFWKKIRMNRHRHTVIHAF